MGYIKGIDRNQARIVTLDSMVAAESHARLVDAFVGSLDMTALGFAPPAAEGRPAYDPRSMLKLYVWGYRKGVRSSRRLAAACRENVEAMWLVSGVEPDFRTVSDFRKDHARSLREVFHEFNRRLSGAVGWGFCSVDGSKFQASNSKSNNLAAHKLDDRISWLDGHVAEYLRRLDAADALEEPTGDDLLTRGLVEAKLAEARERLARYEGYRDLMERDGLSQLSLTDADARLMKSKNGFKGSWLCETLKSAGAEVCGYALEPPTKPNLFGLANVGDGMRSVIADVRDYDTMRRTFDEFRPEVVLHLAAQPIVRESYRDPRGTYETNVMGTVNVLECVRRCDSVRSVLNVTTDKVYLNREWEWGYREDEQLDGHDPYSNSKSCSELATHSYARSFLTEGGVAVSTARAGNVIGDGDFAPDRIVPDCVRAAASGEKLVLRNPSSTRPYQHVLEPVVAYLMIAAMQVEDPSLAGWYNVGPDDAGCVTTGELVGMFANVWEEMGGDPLRWEVREDPSAPHEASFLRLDSSRLKHTFGWRPRWEVCEAVRHAANWYRLWASGADSGELCAELIGQADDYLGEGKR